LKKPSALVKTLQRLYKELRKTQEREWSEYLDTIKRKFPAKVVKGRWFTLDGNTEIMDNRYVKWSHYECLSKEEKKYLRTVN